VCIGTGQLCTASRRRPFRSPLLGFDCRGRGIIDSSRMIDAHPSPGRHAGPLDTRLDVTWG